MVLFACVLLQALSVYGSYIERGKADAAHKPRRGKALEMGMEMTGKPIGIPLEKVIKNRSTKSSKLPTHRVELTQVATPIVPTPRARRVARVKPAARTSLENPIPRCWNSSCSGFRANCSNAKPGFSSKHARIIKRGGPACAYVCEASCRSKQGDNRRRLSQTRSSSPLPSFRDLADQLAKLKHTD